MYVKALSNEQNHTATTYQVDPTSAVEFGDAHIHVDPSELSWEELMEQIGVATESMDRDNVDSSPYGFVDGFQDQPWWNVRWVRFRRPGDPHTFMVAATTPIYLLDDTGKTIDRV